LKRNIIIYIITLSLFFKCAYFNTFYNAEQSFKAALNIIENSPILDEEKLSPEAENFLDKTIKNSLIVIDDYPDSKYIDKAYLLIGISSFYKQSYETSINNLKKVINTEDISIKNEAILWTAYAYLKQEKIDNVETYLSMLSLNELNLESLYIYHIIKAEIDGLNGKLDNSYENYILASETTLKNSRKVYVYRKLIKLAQESDDIESEINFIDLLLDNIEDLNKLKDLKVDWIEAKQKIGDYEDIIFEIDLILSDPIYASIEPKLLIYKARSYKHLNDIISSKQVLEQVVEKFSKKNETSEAYYILASLAMYDDFDLVKSKDYLEESIEQKSRSEYGKKAKELKLKIDKYESLRDDYDFFKQSSVIDTSLKDTKDMNISIPKDSEVALDSLLFNIGQIFYFDFKRIDSALVRYDYILNEFPDSKYANQLNIIIDYHSNASSLNIYDNINLEIDSLSLKRDEALFLSLDESLSYYENMYENYDDFLALFNAAYIYDNYLYDLNNAIPIYYDIQKNYPDHPKIEYISNRLIELNSNIDDLISENDQKDQFYNAFTLIENDYLDSARVILQNMEVKRTKNLYNSVTTLIRYIDQYESMSNEFISQKTNDSLLFHMAKIEYYYFNKSDAAVSKLKQVTNEGPGSQYYNQSIWILSQNIDGYKIDSTLFSLIDTSSIVFYNPTSTWDIKKIRDDNKKLGIIKMQFREE
tara:strand:- start:4063 stop:6171 length:2109 start_codon:yes stop_codon:yes gene_type:complete